MKTQKLLILIIVLVIFSLPLFATGGQQASQEFNYPTSPITITVPFPAGGAADVIVRQIGTLGRNIFPQPIVVRNRPGAGGVIAATEYVAERANPHNILLMSRAMFVTIPLEQEVQYSLSDVEPVIGIENVDFILFVSSNRPEIGSIEQLMEYGQTNSISFGTAGRGTDIDLIQSGLFRDLRTPARAVVFGGAGEAVNNVASGNIDVTAAPPAAAQALVRSGDVIPIGIFSSRPFTGFSGFTVPTLREKGYDIVYPGLNFLGVRAGTDPRIISYLYEKFSEVYALPEFQQFVQTAGFELLPLTPQEVKDYLAEQESVARRLRGN